MRTVEEVTVGLRLPERVETITAERVVRYAGASGDFNRLHWDAAFAAQVSPTGGVIAHGMLTMGLVSAAVTAWAGGPAALADLDVTFKAPCPVDAQLHIGGEVLEVGPAADAASTDDGHRPTARATLAVWAQLEDGTVIVDRRRSRATVRLLS